MNINRNFKDSVFVSLFNNPDLLRDLYCALEGVSLPQDVPVSINTLEKVVYMDLYNDISFEIGGKLIVLIEHQSTINPNMALRLLFYISRVLEKRIESKTLYSSKAVTIPWPEFFVLYNGKEPFPDRQTLKLSELFENPKELGLPEKHHPLLELEVNVININEGRNEEIVNRCRELSEYCIFTSKSYAYLKEFGNKEEAIKETVKYCHKHGILREFLEIQGSEVLNMLLTEWNIDDAKEVWQEEAFEDGLKEGWGKGHLKGHEQGWEKGREDEKQTIARNLLSEGLPIEIIQKTTGLSLEEIKKL